jgi:hypothetical protein
MSTQFFLEETDIDTLINLLLRSQQSRTREALCFSIGIDPKRLSFIRDSSDSDFFLLLIRYLNDIGEQEAICKLCCKELLPVFNHGKYAPILSKIAAKLNCNQSLSQNFTNNQQSTVLPSTPDVSVNRFTQFAKKKFIRYGVLVLIGLAGFVSFIQIPKSLSNPDTTEQPVSPTPNVSPIANRNKLNQQISDIYQEVLRRKPTDFEHNYYVNLLEKGEKLNSIRDWITKTSLLLQEGNVISLKCLGELHTDFKWLDSRIKDNNVSLASNIYASTKWKVRVIGNGVIALENQGVINGSKWLDGLLYNGTVNLAPNTEGHYIGTKWRINIIGNGVVALDNQEKSKWLNGLTANGSVNLAPDIGNNYTGTRWEVIKH